MPFIKKSNKTNTAIVGKTVAINYGRGLVPSGEVGLEIEIEGANIPAAPPGWHSHEDHSLRGGQNREFVIDGPVTFDQAFKSIDELWAKFEEKKTRFDESNRTSVHVHLNVNNWHLDRLAAFSTLWFTFEDLLVNWCGEYRVGNLFCLRGKDAPNTVTMLARFIGKNMQTRLPDRLHYAALNPNAIEKFGSLEIRSLRGTHEAEIVKRWLRILRKIYDSSADYGNDPRRVCEDFSIQGAEQFFATIFQEEGPPLLNDSQWNREEINRSLWEGARIAQDVAYAMDWADFVKEDTATDPFGRKAGKLKNVPLRARHGAVDPRNIEWHDLAVDFQWNNLPPVRRGDPILPEEEV